MGKLIEKYKNSQSYIIVVFITISATIFVMKGSSNSTFIENVNFASTLTSIVLSVIAILLTLIESSKNDSSIERMHQASLSVDASTKTLNESKVKIEEFIIKMTETQEKLKNAEEGYNKVLEIYELKSTDKKKNENDVNAKSHETENSNILKETDLNNFVWKLPYAIRQYLLLIYKTYKHSINLDVNDFNNFYKEILIKDHLRTYDIYDGIITTLYILQGFNLIEFTFTDDRLLKITHLDERLMNAIGTILPDEEGFEDSPAKRLYGSVCRYFDKINNKQK